ncbi:TerC family protein [Paenibacillus yanchengensis]|uniref:TerC family protein n=1 Tax=Paenibacillus yanchengensis TaxID=2035833 RepID=A0ABW4YKL9_9BACL
MEHAFIFFEIVVINLLLSGDNAIVIAMASKQLPANERKIALRTGTFAAIVLRCLLAVVAVTLLKVPYLQAVGAILLFYIALKLLLDANNQTQMKQVDTKQHQSLSKVLQTIIIADLVMSLDNVVAIAAIAQGDFVLVFSGIALSIPIIIWGSNFLSKLLQRFSWIAYVGAALLAYTAGKMFVSDVAIETFGWLYHYSLDQLIPLLSVPLVIVIAILRDRVTV